MLFRHPKPQHTSYPFGLGYIFLPNSLNQYIYWTMFFVCSTNYPMYAQVWRFLLYCPSLLFFLSTLKGAESINLTGSPLPGFPAHCLGTQRKQDQAARRAKGHSYPQQDMYWIILNMHTNSSNSHYHTNI